MTEAIFERRGDGFHATDLARGPWDPDAQHGGAPAALLGGELERLAPHPNLRIVRITYELLRPVPLGELYVQTAITRPGKRVQLLEATLHTADGTELVRARAVRVARAPLGAGTPAEATPAGPQTVATAAPLWNPRSLPGGAVELRYVEGDPTGLGPRTAWFRLKVAVIAGERPTPLQRLLVAADFPNGISNELDWNEWIFINPDLTVYVEREPRSEWVALRARTRVTEGESALAEATLFDTEGRIGRSLQSLYVARAPAKQGG
ncbi:MAG TPA: thioesterase family protein [Solirubrobacteraceae bacterium]|nr:thioesterase family protein [Solirubrobacteraceae bacterium]